MRIVTSALLSACLLPLSNPAFNLFAQSTTLAPAPTNSQTDARESIVAATQDFLELLSDEERALATLPFASEKRVQWHFIPMDSRKGLPLKAMNADQKKAAMHIVAAALSQLGYDKATSIMQLEALLRKVEEGRGGNERNPEKYYVVVFGEANQGQRWGLSFEGHHLSLNFVLQGDDIVDSTPQFFATNPAKLPEGFGEQFKAGDRVLAEEEDLGFKLVNALSDKQWQQAQLPGDTPSEIRAAGEPQPPTTAPRGIAAKDLTAEQRDTLKDLLNSYTDKMRPDFADEVWQAIENQGFEAIHFAWSGAKEPGIGHYYAIQGPTFLVEFINVQPDAYGNPANHIHCVWRDMTGDFDLPLVSR